ncbi:Fpg/Nei family DNA glycosylase [soil metagenome]
MPEGDTVHLAATRLHAALGGETLTRTDLRVPRHATADLSGRVLHEVVARGKHLLFRIEGGMTLHTHFKMDGSWRLLRHGERWPAPGFQARAMLETASWVAVGFLLGAVDLVATSAEHRLVGHLGPDLLGADWDPEEAVRRLRLDRDRPIGEALLDQRALAGIGNVYKCEICFLRGIDPFAPVGSVGDLDVTVALAKRLLEANRATGRQVTTGDLRRGRGRWVYGRVGRACRRCATTILGTAGDGSATGRVTHWCPACQPQ